MNLVFESPLGESEAAGLDFGDKIAELEIDEAPR
jgi:hypothetical protein